MARQGERQRRSPRSGSLLRWASPWVLAATLFMGAGPVRGSCFLYPIDPPSGSLPPATIGVGYTRYFCVQSFNAGWLEWTVTGSLPPGLTTREDFQSYWCSNNPPSLVLQGTPTTAGTFRFALTACGDQCPECETASFLLTVGPPCFTISASTPRASVGARYAGTVTATGGTGPYRYVMFGGTLPPGLRLNSWGVISGVPLVEGWWGFDVSVTDAAGCRQVFPATILVRGKVDLLAGLGSAAANANRVRVLAPSGAVGADVLAYGAGSFGVEASAGSLATAILDAIITGPGPGPAIGPHVRAFDRLGVPLTNVSYFAYGTSKFGVHPAGGGLDGDILDEILTGAGSGQIFGPHVRGWNVEAGPIAPIPTVNYFAYGTLSWGVQVSGGDLDGDGLGRS